MMMENNACGDDDDIDFNDDNGDGHIHFLYQKWQMYFFLFCWTSHILGYNPFFFSEMAGLSCLLLACIAQLFSFTSAFRFCVCVVCQWSLCCLRRFCGCSVFLFLIFSIPRSFFVCFYPNLLLVRLLTLYHSFQCDGMECGVLVFCPFSPALISFLFQRLRWHGLSSCRLQSKLKHQECKFSTCNFSQWSFKVQHFTGEQSTNDWSNEG